MEVPDLQPIIAEGIRPLRRHEYEKLAELGAFEDEKIELLYGVLVPMSPIGEPHCVAIERLMELFVTKLAGRARVRVQMPVAASDDSEPEPDLVVASLDEGLTCHPAKPLLVVEVAETSLAKDRGIKARLYAECGVPEYWVVDLVGRVIEIYRQPREGRYESLAVLGRGEVARPLAFPEVEVAVDSVLAGVLALDAKAGG